ncbi:hypothetical protein [Pseudomonas sp. 18175]|uniref:hypothetical protein n=1 Tax=Pseudomonas sp. 18175 TaxID=3390056 RepID=UPI003D22781F
MKTRNLGVSILSLLALAGCESEKASSEFAVEKNSTLEPSTIVAIRQACPGLDKYAWQFKNIRIEKLFRRSILFDVPERSRIPDAYKAGGHTCYLEVSSDDKTLFIEKLACKSICLDQLNTPAGQLKLPLTGEQP